MERFKDLTQIFIRAAIAMVVLFPLVACGNGGSINFVPQPRKVGNKGAAVTMVPAGEALITEFGQTPATGHSAKIQINPVKGTQLTGGGYTLKLKHTVRNR